MADEIIYDNFRISKTDVMNILNDSVGNSPLISIVIPMYNSGRYIEGCLNSILSQKYITFEVIIVNDGSTDDSFAICNSYLSKHRDCRLTLINKENGGLSDARNFGLKHCDKNAEYVIFVDSDDELTPDCLSVLIKYASHDCLAIGTLLRCVKGNIPHIDDPNYPCIRLLDIWHNPDFLHRLKDGILNSCCGNLYSLKVIREHNIVFKKILPEDTFFNFEYLSVISSVVLIKKPLYLYYIWVNSMSTQPKEEIYTNYMRLQQLICEKVSEKHYSEIDSFVYPQYRVNSMNFLKQGEFTIPRKYLGEKLIKRAMDSYSPTTFADMLLHLCLKYRLLKFASLF